MNDRTGERLKLVCAQGCDWGFANCANVYFESQDEYKDEPFMSVRGGELNCFKSLKNEEKDAVAMAQAKAVVDRWNEALKTKGSGQ
jgi:hypothetical protein